MEVATICTNGQRACCDDLSGEQTGHPEELRHPAAGRVTIDRFGRSALNDPALMQKRQAVTQADRFLLVVRHVDGGNTGFMKQGAQFLLQFHT